MTADASGRSVLAGPIESTALGNLIVQLMADGSIASLAEGRELVARSFPLEEFLPEADPRWQDAYGRFRALLGEAPPLAATTPAASSALFT
jgi:rhamnulokinase